MRLVLSSNDRAFWLNACPAALGWVSYGYRGVYLFQLSLSLWRCCCHNYFDSFDVFLLLLRIRTASLDYVHVLVSWYTYFYDDFAWLGWFFTGMHLFGLESAQRRDISFYILGDVVRLSDKT